METKKSYRQGRALDFSDNYIFLAVIAKTESLTSAITFFPIFQIWCFWGEDYMLSKWLMRVVTSLTSTLPLASTSASLRSKG